MIMNAQMGFLINLLFFSLVFSISFKMDVLKIGSINVNGAREGKKRASIYETAKIKQVDVLFLQETHSDEGNEADWRREWEGEVILSHNTSLSGGVGFLLSKAFTPVSLEVEHFIEGRLLLVKAGYDAFTAVFINVYAPTIGAERKVFLDKLSDVLNGCATEDFLFLGGDFNCTENEVLDRNHAEPHPASQHALRQLVSAYGLVDVWRRMHADCRQYTWSHLRESRISSARLDSFYCFKHHFNIYKSCTIVPAVFTDHSLVLCNVIMRNIKPKSAYWHFNSVLTFDKKFREVLVYFWEDFRQRKGDFSSLRQWWDHGKIQIKLLCQQHTLNVTRDITRSMKDLEIDIVELENLSESTGDRGYIEILKVKKLSLADLLDTKAQGALVRSRFQASEEMDAPSSYFFGLERKNGQGRVIHTLLSETGEEIVEPSQIRRRAVEFYSALYTSEHEEDDGLMEGFTSGLPQVSEETNSCLEGPIQEQELRAALQGMQARRAPGIDGLTVEFFKAFWDIFKNDLLDVFNESLASGSMPTSCRRAVITLLPKKGNLQSIKNWHPVSLLCVDYKLLSKLFASRLGMAMEHLIHRDQTYCVSGRSMVDNVHLIRNVLDVSNSLGCNTGLISLDQEKAFDRVEHNFLWKVMEKFGFSAGFIAKIKVMYSDVESVLKINGSLCAPFRVCRGVRQGCALSGMLYALSLEPLLNKIRFNIEGLILPGFSGSIVLSAYADDLIVFTKNQREIDILENIINDFTVLSAARVNWEKSEALAVGDWSDGLPVLPRSLSWKREGLKYLGIFLGNEAVMRKNWEAVLEKAEGKMKKWRWLLPQMSYRGRVLILNNLVASLLWHRLSCVDPPSGLLAEIQKKMVDFFWGGLHWVPQGVLYLPREEGGQGLIHLASRTATFRIQFIKRYLTGPTDLVWRNVTSCILRHASKVGLDTALFLTDSKFLKLNGFPPFYQGVFKSWALFNRNVSENINSLHWLLKEPLIHGSRLDICTMTPGLLTTLYKAKTVSLQQLVEAAGPELTGAAGLGSLLGVRSVRVAQQLLELWRRRLSETEKSLLIKHSRGEAMPDPTDPFPDIILSPELGEESGPLLAVSSPGKLSLHRVDKTTIYRMVTKVLNKKGLSGRPPTVWSKRPGWDGARPEWRVIYKPPLKKQTADLQWRILHGAIASNAFITVLNPAVSNQCPFCGLRETVFHVFTECPRLARFFSFLTLVFSLFNVFFTEKVFIFGAGYKKTNSEKWQLINYLLGEAKMAVYISRRNKVEEREGHNAHTVFLCNIRARVWLEFQFYRTIEDVDAFKQRWCYGGFICSVVNNVLIFAPDFIG